MSKYDEPHTQWSYKRVLKGGAGETYAHWEVQGTCVLDFNPGDDHRFFGLFPSKVWGWGGGEKLIRQGLDGV